MNAAAAYIANANHAANDWARAQAARTMVRAAMNSNAVVYRRTWPTLEAIETAGRGRVRPGAAASTACWTRRWTCATACRWWRCSRRSTSPPPCRNSRCCAAELEPRRGVSDRYGVGAGFAGTRAEDRRPDPHPGRAFGDRGLQVGAHAHRQACPAPGPSAFSASSSSRSARCGARCAARSPAGSGIAIRPRSFSRGSAATSRASASAASGATPLLLSSPLMLTCRHTCSGASSGGRWSDRRCAELQPVDRVHPVEVRGDLARLVALERADQVPARSRGSRAGRPVRRSWPALPARSSRRNRAGRRRTPRARKHAGHVLLDGQQRDASRGRRSNARQADEIRPRTCSMFSAMLAISGRSISPARRHGPHGHHPTARVFGQEQGLRPAPVRRACRR